MEDVKRCLDQAGRAFSENKLAECAKLLQKMKDGGGGGSSGDLKLQHNIALVELYRSKNFSLETFDRFAKSISQKCSSDPRHPVCANPVILHNVSVFLYFTQQFEAAVKLLDKLCGEEGVEKLKCDADLHMSIAFLLSECLIRNQQSERALTTLTWIESKLLSAALAADKSKDAKSKNDKLLNRLYVLKANVNLLTKSMKVCKKDIRSLSATSTQSFGVPVAFIKANYEYIRRNYTKSIRMLQISQYRPHTETGESIPLMYYNNLGCIHHHTRKHALGVFYMRKSVQELNSVQAKSKKSPVTMMGVSAMRPYELQYNMGIHLLTAGYPDEAFDCLSAAVQVYSRNPRLWLRLAECCIAVHSRNESSEVSLVEAGGPPGNPHHRLVIQPPPRENLAHDTQSAAFPAATLGFGSLCVENVLMIINKHRNDANGIACRPAGNIRSTDVEYLEIQALTSGAYISLGLSNFIKARNYCQKALAKPRIPGSLKYCLNMYLAEALVHLNKLNDAIEMMTNEKPAEFSLTIGFDSDQSEKNDRSQERTDSPVNADQQTDKSSSEAQSNIYPSSPALAACYHYTNLACMYCLKQEFERARACLQTASQNCQALTDPVPSETLVCAAYIELAQGNKHLAIQILQRKQIPNYRALTAPAAAAA